MKVSRDEVFKTINSERAYQNALWGNDEPTFGSGDIWPSIHAYIVFMDVYLAKAKKVITEYGDGSEQALHAIRKLTALGVACMETHGAPLRDPVTPKELDFERHRIWE